MGYNREASYTNLQKIREHTYDGVKDWRIEIAESVWLYLKGKKDFSEGVKELEQEEEEVKQRPKSVEKGRKKLEVGEMEEEFYNMLHG